MMNAQKAINKTLCWHVLTLSWIAIVLVFASTMVFSAEPPRSSGTSADPRPCTLEFAIHGAIGPGTYDWVVRAEQKAGDLGCASLFLKINTPGGSLASTRKIVERIMNSPIPFLCLVSPSGGHAGSAGAIILQACHVSGGLEATNIGAASPINGSGEEMSETLKKKIFEDTRSWVEGLAKYRGRSLEFARDIILKATALDAREAAAVGGIDTVATSEDQFLSFAEKLKVRVNAEEKTPVVVGGLEVFEADLRYKVMDFLANPQWAYLIFMASLGLLYFELTHIGVLLPGVVGAIGLVVSMMNFHMLDVSWGAVALIILGIGFMFAELFVPSFGALGLGGIASFFLGSLFLFDGDLLGAGLPLSMVFATTLPFSVFTGLVTYLAWRTLQHGVRNRKKESWRGRKAVVKDFHPTKKTGMVVVDGEFWKCVSRDDLFSGDHVAIENVKGLTLWVRKVKEEDS